MVWPLFCTKWERPWHKHLALARVGNLMKSELGLLGKGEGRCVCCTADRGLFGMSSPGSSSKGQHSSEPGTGCAPVAAAGPCSGASSLLRAEQRQSCLSSKHGAGEARAPRSSAQLPVQLPPCRWAARPHPTALLRANMPNLRDCKSWDAAVNFTCHLAQIPKPWWKVLQLLSRLNYGTTEVLHSCSSSSVRSCSWMDKGSLGCCSSLLRRCQQSSPTLTACSRVMVREAALHSSFYNKLPWAASFWTRYSGLLDPC